MHASCLLCKCRLQINPILKALQQNQSFYDGYRIQLQNYQNLIPYPLIILSLSLPFSFRFRIILL